GDVKDPHHPRPPALGVAQRPAIADVDVRLAEEVGRLLLDRLRDRFRVGLEETHPGKEHGLSPMTQLPQHQRCRARNMKSESCGNGRAVYELLNISRLTISVADGNPSLRNWRDVTLAA